jgi:Subtilase family/Secretion system C-terminal sorting domain
MKRLLYHFLSLLLLCAVAAQAQQHSIYLKSGTLHPEANAARWMDSINATPAHEPVQVLVHFATLPTPQQKEQLRQCGISLSDYLPDDTYHAIIRGAVDKDKALGAPIYSITNVRPEWKADSYLWHQVTGQKGETHVMVSFCKGADTAEAMALIGHIGGRRLPSPMRQYGYYKIALPGTAVHSLAQWYGTRYISISNDNIAPLDLQSRAVVKNGVATGMPIYGGYGLTGDSVTVGVGDDCSGIYHADLKDRLTNFNPAPMNYHGEHVNGLVGGCANIDPLALGMAPHALLVDHFFDFILATTGTLYNDYNMTVTNNSYEISEHNCAYAGTYDTYAELVDTLSMQYPDVLHVFASGNDGAGTCTPYLQGFGTVGGGYQCAKNNIDVGSITDFVVQASDESRGPILDGRLKPEIVAVGLGAYSTVVVDQYLWSAGTSMASPHVAGGLAILTQRYKQMHSGTQPRSDVLKAVLLDGAMDIGNAGPDFSYGFGVMDLYRSLQILDANNINTGSISDGDSASFTFTVPAGAGQVKVMLCWNDRPGSPGAAKELVNDLDLVVTGPTGDTHLPLVLNSTPDSVTNLATEQPDHINNVEQATISAPATGSYTIHVKGYHVPEGPQRFVVAYDIIPQALHVTFPIGGEQLQNLNSEGDSLRIFWDAVSDGNTFKIELSQDNGTTWFTEADNLDPSYRNYDMPPPPINSGQCKVRVSRNNTTESATSGAFAINTQPVMMADTAQCPGYANVHWSLIPNATAYYLLRKIGPYMQVVDSTVDTVYSFGNLPLTEPSYLQVQPVFGHTPGYRAVALKITANSGNCTLPVSNGDLMIQQAVGPASGRMYTSSRLTGATTTQVLVRDLYSAPCSSYSVSYSVNGGTWATIAAPATIPANGTAVLSLPGITYPTPGTYTITAAIHNLALTDPQPHNDTLTFTVQNIPNDTIDLSTPFTDGFESMGVFSVSHDSVAVSPNGHWDYANINDSGRMRSFVSDDITISGSRSVSLDENQNVPNGSSNTFTGTFNLGGYDTSLTEVRVDFDYILHGTPKTATGNIVQARGNDAAVWSSFYNYNLAAYPGFVTNVRSLSLTDVLRGAGTNFSTSTQVAFGQNDTSLISAIDFGNGMTIDNFKLYTVSNDAALVSVVSPAPTNCGLPSPQPLVVQVHNGVNYTLHNVQLYYTLNGGTVNTDIIDSIPAKATIDHTFTTPMVITLGRNDSLNIWLSTAGDTYTANDSILNYQFRNSNIVTSYPYLENFEQGDGGYFSGGFRDSWQYGTPASPRVYKAASGTKAWKTNLTGNYNNLELSYLYSPCFDISSLTHPMLSFSAALDVENCGPSTLCDAAWVEYSYDGDTWTKLGATRQGYNWYDSSFDVWNTEGFTRWHVVSIPLPVTAPGQIIHFRFVMSADPGVTFEGFALDDIHIFDKNYDIAAQATTPAALQGISGNVWTDIALNNKLLASVQPGTQTLGNTDIRLYPQTTATNPGATQYILPRNYTIIDAPEDDSVLLRLYLLDSDVVQTLSDTSCPSCSRFPDAYSLGITQYTHTADIASENGTLADDTGGIFAFYPDTVVQWVPYDQGYYAQIKATPYSEFWFNDGGPTGLTPAGLDYVYFNAFRQDTAVKTIWYSNIDSQVNAYTVQRADSTMLFDSILSATARRFPYSQYTINDPNSTNYPALYYRLTWKVIGKDSTYYSPVRTVRLADSANALISFSAAMSAAQKVFTTWNSPIDGITSEYILEREISDGGYDTILSKPSYHIYNSSYNFTDVIGQELPDGTPIHYRLTALLQDGTTATPAIQTVHWVDGSAISALYPNPTHNAAITIVWSANPGSNMGLVLTDVTGKRVFETTLRSAQWNNTTAMQTPRLPDGVYFLRMEINGKKYIKKIVYE